MQTYAASSKLIVVLNPSVAVNLCYLFSSPILQISYQKGKAYVGKKFTKLNPKSCEQVLKAKSKTFGSLIAMIKPPRALERQRQYIKISLNTILAP